MPHAKQSIFRKSSNPVILNLIENQSKNIIPISPLHLWRGVRGEVRAFTLVELIVVIVILAILATIAFLSFNSYSSSSRDSVRLADISNIAKGLTLQYTVGGYYILPDNSVNLYSGSTLIGYQGKAGSNTLNTIKLSANTNNTSGRDPIDNTYYTYNTNINKNRYQVTGYLENKGTIINRTSSINNGDSVILSLSKNPFLSLLGDYTSRNNEQTLINNIMKIPAFTTGTPFGRAGMTSNINQTYATTYTNRFPYLKGDNIGVILNYTGTTSNPIYTPIEDITTSTGIDISSGTLTSGKVVISNNSDSFTGVSVISMSGYTTVNVVSNNVSTDGTSSSSAGSSCLSIKTNYPASIDGTYWIKPDSNPAFQVYCDMTTDGGGWMLAISVFSASSFSCGVPTFGGSTNYVNCNLQNSSVTKIKELLYNGSTQASSNTLTTTPFILSNGYLDQTGMVFGISGTQKSLGANGNGTTEYYASIDANNYFAYSSYYNNHFTGFGSQIYGTDLSGGGNSNNWSLNSYAGVTHNKVYIYVK